MPEVLTFSWTSFREEVNSLIQAAKARAGGYRNPRNLITVAYIIAGKLNFKSLILNPLETSKSPRFSLCP
ncbi:hypothetical protein GHYDROH2_10510 [Geobacter hydrogenophilus]|uniref:Transposase n=1 Tax=Geobacter hydrogenophilus TaxID=40983 RepID=A0A9W6FYR9_9BACT|nr:hypothetical protein GHYDROH2_10510 [Geobacter hydrogenophilus]